MKAYFEYKGSRSEVDTRDQELTPAQIKYLGDCEARGVTEFVIPIDKMLVKIDRLVGGEYVLFGYDIEIAP